MTSQQRREWGLRVGTRDARRGLPRAACPFMPSPGLPEMYRAWHEAYDREVERLRALDKEPA